MDRQKDRSLDRQADRWIDGYIDSVTDWLRHDTVTNWPTETHTWYKLILLSNYTIIMYFHNCNAIWMDG